VSQQSVEIVNKRIDDLENKINNLQKRIPN